MAINIAYMFLLILSITYILEIISIRKLINKIEKVLKGVNNKVLNLNHFAKEITEEEGLKESLSVAQVKEVLHLTFEKLSELKSSEVMLIVEKYSK